MKPLTLGKVPRRSIAANSNGARLTGTPLKIAGIAAGYAKRGEGISKKLLATTLCGMSVEGGGFNERLSEARTAGAITTEGGMVYATSKGVERFGDAFKALSTTNEVLALWRPRLSGKSLQMFDHLVSLGGRSIIRPAPRGAKFSVTPEISATRVTDRPTR